MRIALAVLIVSAGCSYDPLPRLPDLSPSRDALAVQSADIGRPVFDFAIFAPDLGPPAPDFSPCGATWDACCPGARPCDDGRCLYAAIDSCSNLLPVICVPHFGLECGRPGDPCCVKGALNLCEGGQLCEAGRCVPRC